LIPTGRLGTWSESLALARLVAARRARSVVVCTSDYHMPRAILSVRRALHGLDIAGVAVAPLRVPEPAGSALASAGRARSPMAWALLLQEWFKWGAYALAARVGRKTES